MWSWIKRAAKKVWRVVKAVVRLVVRVVLVLATILFKIWDLCFGFVAWPPKRMKVHVVVLRDQNGPLIQRDQLEAVLARPIEILKQAYKEHCNITVSPYQSGNEREIDNWVQILPDPAPVAALQSSDCSVGSQLDEQETGEAGDYFRDHVAGWVGGIPISLAFPVTVFVVSSIGQYFGCTIPFLADYCLVTVAGIQTEPSTIAHEIGHSCNIPKEDPNPTYLMFAGNEPNRPPYRFRGWQKNLVRSSRHATYLF